MAYISCNKLWESQFDNIVSKRDKIQYNNINQSELEVHDSYKKDRKIINFEAVNDEDVINKAYLDKELLKIDGYISILEKTYSEFKKPNDKHTIEEVSIQRAVKTTIQILFDNGLFDSFSNADDVSEGFFVRYKTLR